MYDLLEFGASVNLNLGYRSMQSGYDPIPMASPYTIKFRLLIRETFLSHDKSEFSSKKSCDNLFHSPALLIGLPSMRKVSLRIYFLFLDLLGLHLLLNLHL